MSGLMIELIILVYSFVIGIAIGSFSNMLVYRVHFKKPLTGRSFCDFTGQPLGVKDLIPILSFVIYKGRCRVCHDKLPLLYPAVELTFGLATVLLSALFLEKHTVLPVAVFFIVAFWLVMIAGLYDLLYWKLPAVVLKTGLLALVIFRLILVMLYPELLEPMLTALELMLVFGVVSAIFIRFTGGVGMSSAEPLLFAFIGLILPVPLIIPAFLITLFTGTFLGIIRMSATRNLQQKIQLAPVLAFGALAAFLMFF
jgi:prepilin signal peptidase PulO-like enzyme (type II secretory pathway)